MFFLPKPYCVVSRNANFCYLPITKYRTWKKCARWGPQWPQRKHELENKSCGSSWASSGSCISSNFTKILEDESKAWVRSRVFPVRELITSSEWVKVKWPRSKNRTYLCLSLCEEEGSTVSQNIAKWPPALDHSKFLCGVLGMGTFGPNTPKVHWRDFFLCQRQKG
jgi:hypothetical protein